MKIRLAALSVVLGLSAIACDEQPFEPSEGIWYQTVTPADINTCQGNSPGYQSTFTIQRRNGGFLVITDGGKVSFTCDLDDTDFECTYPLITGVEGVDATLSYEIDWTGSFNSETRLLGDIVTQLSCFGDGCEALTDLGALFPCVTRARFTAERI
jgi:hypothetical protein